MSTITPSDTALAYLQQFTPGQQRFDLSEQSDTTGHTATRLGGPPRWTVALRTLDALEPEISAIWKAIVVQMRGRVNHLAIHDVTQPQPRGTVRGSTTLGATAAAGAASITLAGAWTSSPILAPQGLDDAVWTKQGCSVTTDALAGPDLTNTAEAIIESSGTGGGNGHGVRQTVSLSAGIWTLSWYVRALERTRCSMWAFGTPVADTTSAVYDTASVAASGTGSPGIAADANFYYRCTRRFTLATGGDVTIHIGPQDAGTTQAYNGDGISRIAVWGVQLDAGAVALPYVGRATLLAGDWLQIGAGVGSHYCMVTADAIANDNGGITVAIEPPTRKSFTSGAAVTWDKPKGHFKQRPDSLSWSGAAGSSMVGGFAFDLMEDWNA